MFGFDMDFHSFLIFCAVTALVTEEQCVSMLLSEVFYNCTFKVALEITVITIVQYFLMFVPPVHLKFSQIKIYSPTLITGIL